MGRLTLANKSRKARLRRIRLSRKSNESFRSMMMEPGDWTRVIECAGIDNTDAVNRMMFMYARRTGKLVYVFSKRHSAIAAGILTRVSECDVVLTVTDGYGNFAVVSPEEFRDMSMFANKPAAEAAFAKMM